MQRHVLCPLLHKHRRQTSYVLSSPLLSCPLSATRKKGYTNTDMCALLSSPVLQKAVAQIIHVLSRPVLSSLHDKTIYQRRLCPAPLFSSENDDYEALMSCPVLFSPPEIALFDQNDLASALVH
jgi:hypothetical protein